MLLKLNFTGLLGEGARHAAGREQAVARRVALDLVVAAGDRTVTHTNDPSDTAALERGVGDGVVAQQLSAFGVGVATLQRLETGFVLAVDGAGEEPSKNKRDGVFSTVKETGAPVTLPVRVVRQVLAVAVPAADAHAGLAFRLLRHIRHVFEKR